MDLQVALEDVLPEGAAYLVLPRVVAERMPLEWQRTMDSLMREVRDEHGHLPYPASYLVTARRSDGRFIKDPVREHFNGQ